MRVVFMAKTLTWLKLSMSSVPAPSNLIYTPSHHRASLPIQKYKWLLAKFLGNRENARGNLPRTGISSSVKQEIRSQVQTL